MTCFIVIFTLLQFSGTEPAISLRYAYIDVILGTMCSAKYWGCQSK